MDTIIAKNLTLQPKGLQSYFVPKKKYLKRYIFKTTRVSAFILHIELHLQKSYSCTWFRVYCSNRTRFREA